MPASSRSMKAATRTTPRASQRRGSSTSPLVDGGEAAVLSVLTGSSHRSEQMMVAMRPARRWRIWGRKAWVTARVSNRLTSNWPGSGGQRRPPRAEDEDPGGVGEHVEPVPVGVGVDLVAGVSMEAWSMMSRTTGRTRGARRREPRGHLLGGRPRGRGGRCRRGGRWWPGRSPRRAGHQDESRDRWGCWPGGHGRGLGGHGVSPAGW
jgi:hypothetical protein